MAEAATVTDETDLPTPRTTLTSRFVRVLITCWHCRHQADVDLPALIAAGRGDILLVRLRWRCARCRNGRVDMVVNSRPRSCHGELRPIRRHPTWIPSIVLVTG